MPYIRKTEDEFDIEAYYGHGWEIVTCEDTYREARKRLREYRENEPGVSFRIKKRRVKCIS